MNVLYKPHILLLHSDLIEESGGLDGIRDEGMLDSAINAPYQTYGGKDLFPTLFEKAVRLGYGLIKNHPFIDGNKRIGTHAMTVFLDINGIELGYEDRDIIDVILKVADGTSEYEDLLEWVLHHVK